MDRKPLILAIDDDPYYLNEIKLEVQGRADYKLFDGPNEFEAKVSTADIANADLIIVDYDFGAGTAVKSGLADFIRKGLGYKGKLALCSLHEDFRDNEKQVRKEYDVVIHKRDLRWDTIVRSMG